MKVHFTTEQEVQLTNLAIKTGTDLERMVKDAALRLLDEKTSKPAVAPALPLLHLGAMQSLRRRDLYDDVR